MNTITVNENVFELVANSSVFLNDWVVQVSPDHSAYFNGIKGQVKFFVLNDECDFQLEGYVLKTDFHTYNQGTPQLQVQVRRKGW